MTIRVLEVLKIKILEFEYWFPNNDVLEAKEGNDKINIIQKLTLYTL